MPLTSLATCYKTLPSYFADKVTQQMRKRRESYLTANTQEDNKEMKNIFYCKTTPFSSIESGTGSEALMTKRSCTPLATVSDNESEDGSSPCDGTGGATSRCLSANEDKADSPGYLMSTVNYVIRQQRSPRTAISLDNVDLWEEEEEEEEGEGEELDVGDRNSPGFDRINGVPINPRSTIDFSELRRSRSPVVGKRNRSNEDPDGWTTKTIQKTNIADLVSVKKSLLEARNKSRVQRMARKVPKTTSLVPHTRTNDKVTSHQYRLDHVVKDHVVKDHVVKGHVVKGHVVKDHLVNDHLGKDHIRSPVDNKMSNDRSNIRMPPLSSTYTFTDSNPALILATNGGASNHSATSTVKVKELSRVNSKLAVLRATNTSSTQAPISDRETAARDDLKRVRDLDSRCSADSNGSSGSTGTSPERKVKFNSFVTVRQGEVNTYGYLRESQNSAQVIKQKYLSSNYGTSRS